MSEARIYQPTKTAMQSGQLNTKQWVLEFEPKEPKRADPLMGWIGSGDMEGQVRLQFNSKEEAIAFAKKKGIIFGVQEPKMRRIKPKSYSSVFSYNRRF